MFCSSALEIMSKVVARLCGEREGEGGLTGDVVVEEVLL